MTETHFICLNRRQEKSKGRGFAEMQPLQVYDHLIDSPHLSELIRRINATTDEDRQRELKSELPFICPHYSGFRDNARNQASIDASQFTFTTTIDIDDKALVEQAREKALELNHQQGGTWEDMVMHMAYSARKKLHIDILLPVGMTVAEGQRAFCQELGVEPDTTCFTPERFIYVTPREFEIYRSPEWCQTLSEEQRQLRQQAYLDRGLTIDGRTAKGHYYDPEKDDPLQGKQPAISTTTATTTAKTPSQTFPTAFKGIAYEDIIAEYWRLSGGQPAEGERNKKLHLLACHLRSICDNNPQWLMQVMPWQGLSEQEMRAITHSACKEPTRGSKLITEILQKIAPQGEWQEDETPVFRLPSHIKSALPHGMKEALVGVPQYMQMPVLVALMPMLATYADGVEVKYCDGQKQLLTLQGFVFGGQASGKSICKQIIDFYKEPLVREDTVGHEAEQQWNELKKTRKANEKIPDDPKPVIRVMPPNFSRASLLRRLMNAQGHSVFVFSDELDSLTKGKKAGRWAELDDILRKSFDSSEWGQDYVSAESVSGLINVRLNVSMLGTWGAMQRFFAGDSVENGSQGRGLFALLPDTAFSKMPQYGHRSAADDAHIQQAIQRLRTRSGFIDTPRLRKAIDKWNEEKRMESLMDYDKVKDTFRRRSAVIGFRCGVIYHLLTDKQRETKGCIDFALMMADYCLSMQLQLFGTALQKKQQEEEEQRSENKRGANQLIFPQLPSTFVLRDLAALKGNNMSRPSLMRIINRWEAARIIDKIADGKWQKLPLKQLSKPRATRAGA